MNDLYLIIYEMRNKEIIYRLTKYHPPYENHAYTSMGWYIVDIQRFYKGSFISLKQYDENLKEEIEKYHKKYDKRNQFKMKKFEMKKHIIHKIFKKYL